MCSLRRDLKDSPLVCATTSLCGAIEFAVEEGHARAGIAAIGRVTAETVEHLFGAGGADLKDRPATRAQRTLATVLLGAPEPVA